MTFIETTDPHRLRYQLAQAKIDRAYYIVELARLDAERAALLADRDGLYAGEYDRMTQHAAALERQKTGPQETVDMYDRLIAATEKKLNRNVNVAEPLRLVINNICKVSP